MQIYIYKEKISQEKSEMEQIASKLVQNENTSKKYPQKNQKWKTKEKLIQDIMRKYEN